MEIWAPVVPSWLTAQGRLWSEYGGDMARTKKPPDRPGVYEDVPLADYLAIRAIHSGGLRRMGKGARAYWHAERFEGEPPSDAMKAGSLAHIQILDSQAYLTRVVEWTELVMEEPPKLAWVKGSGCYATECGKYRLESSGGRWRPMVAIDPLQWTAVDLANSVTAAKRACQAHHDRLHPARPKIYPDGSTKLSPMNENSARFKAFLEANPGREIVTADDLAKARRIAMAVRDNPDAREALSERWRTELTLVWVHPTHGVLCKARLDWLTDPRRSVCTIGELKLAREIEERRFSRASAGYGYHCQLAWYGDGLKAHFPGVEIQYLILAVESTGSHDCTVFDLDDDEIEAGRKQNQEWLREIVYYRDTYGDRPWPGRCSRTWLNYAEHCPKVLGHEGPMGGIDLSGVERINGTEDPDTDTN